MALPITNPTSRPWFAAAAPSQSSVNNAANANSGDFRSALGSIVLPTEQNVQELSAELAGSLKSALQKAGIPAKPPFTLSVDPSNGHISVSGNRSDAKQIEDLINNNAELTKQVRDTNAIASQAEAVRRALEFEQEYMASNDPKSVIAKYSDLFGVQTSHSYALEFDGSGVQPLVDGAMGFSS